MAEDPTPDKMAELQESMRRLEAKLAELGANPKGAPGGDAAVAQEPSTREPAAIERGDEKALETSFAGAAVLCGVLVCALLLRRAAEAWVTPAQAPFIGIGYCAALAALSAALFPRTRAMGALLGHSALVLGLLIVLETHLGRGSLSLGRAQATLAALAVAGVALGWGRKAPAIATVGILGASYLAAFLGPNHAVFIEVALGLAVAGSGSLALAYALEWRWLRWPLFVLAQLFAAMWAIYLRVQGADAPASTRLAGYAVGVAVLELPFLLACAWPSLRARRPQDGFEVSAPLAATAIPVLLFMLGGAAIPIAVPSIFAAALLGFGTYRAVTRNEHTAGGAFLLAGAVQAAWWWPLLPIPLLVSGAATSALGAGLFFLGRHRGPTGSSARSVTAVAHLLQALVVARMITLGGVFLVGRGAGPSSVGLALFLGLLATAQYIAARMLLPPRAAAPRKPEPDREAVIAIVAAAVSVFSAVRVGAHLGLHPSAPLFQAIQSITVCLIIAGALSTALFFGVDDLLEVSILALVLYGAKIVFYDVFTLPVAFAAPAVSALALVLGLASVAIRARKRRAAAKAAPPE